jgi:serine/threonine-protein kinase
VVLGAAVVAAIVLVAVLTFLILQGTVGDSSRSSSPTTVVTPSRTVGPTSPVLSATAIATNPTTPTFRAKSIDTVLLSAADLNTLLGTYAKSGDREVGMMKLDDSSYGMSDNSALVTPLNCVGVVFTAEHAVYGDTGFEEMRHQTFSPEPYVYDPSKDAPTVVEQSVTAYPTAAAAQALLASSEQQWRTCSAGKVDQRIPPEDGRGFVLGSVQRQGDVLTVSMASNSGYSGAHACQQALGVRENVVVAARVCADPTSVSNPAITGDPDWATEDADRLAAEMLKRITI